MSAHNPYQHYTLKMPECAVAALRHACKCQLDKLSDIGRRLPRSSKEHRKHIADAMREQHTALSVLKAARSDGERRFQRLMQQAGRPSRLIKRPAKRATPARPLCPA